jgi:Putative restriction endonuclease
MDRAATLEDLYAVDGKAELVDGSIIVSLPTGDAHATAAKNIVFRLTEYEWENGGGRAYADGVGFIASARRPERRSAARKR